MSFKVPSPTFCSMPWNHQFLDPSGRVKPCCRFVDAKRPSSNNLSNKTLTEIFEGPFMQGVRDKMLHGEQVPGCERCYQEEAAGKKSLRERYNASSDLPIQELIDLSSPKIRWLELAISNDCNLACRMCDSRYSWKWHQEEIKSFGQPRAQLEYNQIDIDQLNPFIHDLVHLKFTGGEPLITPGHWKFLDRLLAERSCSNIMLNYSTNCTIMPKPEWIEKWSKFKRVEFALSFDSINPCESEYIRWPSKFETTSKVTTKFLELKKSHGFDSLLRSTISVLNIWNMPETMAWWWAKDPGPNKTMNPTHLTYPEILSVTVLPKNLKIKIQDKFENFQSQFDVPEISKSLSYIVKIMNRQDDSNLLPELRNYLQKTDEFRAQNFAKSYPQFQEIWNL